MSGRHCERERFVGPEPWSVPLPVFGTREAGYQDSAPTLDRRSRRHRASAVHSSRRQRPGARGHGRLMAESLDEPLGVVAGDELADDPTRLGETLEAMEIEALLLQRAHEALDDAVALRLADVRRR